MAAKRLLIRGRVQGVFYRSSMSSIAMAEGVRGWVRNLRDGSVEAWIEGDEESLVRVIEWCKTGPPGSLVSCVEIQQVNPVGCEGFMIVQ